MNTIAAALALVGAVFLFLGALGVLKFPDVFCRGHALGKGVTLGIALVLIGLWMDLGVESAGIKIPLALLFQFATIPVASHLLARAAYHRQRVGRDQSAPPDQVRPD